MSWRVIWMTGLGLSAVLAGGAVFARDWNVQLYDGTAVRVDPRTHKAWVDDAGGSRPLWDGVHRLDDGTVLRIQSGVMIPEKAYVEAQRGELGRVVPQQEVTAYEQRYTAVDPGCVDLVKKTCGADDACSKQQACDLARQLRQFQLDEWRESGFNDWTSEAGTQCAEALRDETMFPRCAPAKQP